MNNNRRLKIKFIRIISVTMSIIGFFIISIKFCVWSNSAQCVPVSAESIEDIESLLPIMSDNIILPILITDSVSENVNSEKDKNEENSIDDVNSMDNIDDNLLPCTPYIDLTNDEIYELATLVWLEARGESVECQKAVASVVINRMKLGDLSLHDVIYAKNQFTPAKLISSSCPDDISLAAVMNVVTMGPNIPEYVTYFRAGHYHNWSDAIVPYECIDHTYFSYDINLYNKVVGD